MYTGAVLGLGLSVLSLCESQHAGYGGDGRSRGWSCPSPVCFMSSGLVGVVDRPNGQD